MRELRGSAPQDNLESYPTQRVTPPNHWKPLILIGLQNPLHPSHRCALSTPPFHARQHTRAGEPDRWLFDEGGKPWHDNLVDYRWRSTRTDAGLTTKLHDLRHYFASGLIAAGCDVVTVQRAMGHASATTTLSTYAHLWPTAEDKTRSAASEMAAAVLATGVPAQVDTTRSRQ